MLSLTVPSIDMEFFDDRTQQFITIHTEEQPLVLEHSLISLSKWESKWCIPFFGNEEKTNEQVIDYIKCMTLTKNVPEDVFLYMPEETHKQIAAYIQHPNTATTVHDLTQQKKRSREIITAEIIYYGMVAYQIPFECQKWHINRLMTLIQVCEIKNSPKKKMSRREAMAQQRRLNEMRKAKLGTTG